MPKKILKQINDARKSKVGKAITKEIKQMAKKEAKRRIVNAVVPRGVNYIGGRLGIPPSVSAKVGNTVAAHINKLTGSGDYTMSTPAHNSLLKGAGGAAPSFNDKQHRITHREYICDIFTGTTVGAFNSTQFVINPADATTFPYLSNTAALFEKYKFHGLVFEFISTVGQYSAGALGSVIISSAFNSSFPVFINKTQMENMENAISARTDTNLLYGVECKEQVQNYYYVKHFNTTQKANTNVANLYDLADVSIATYGGSIAANTNIGELWVSYDVEFSGPRLPDQRPAYLHSYTQTGTPTNPLNGSKLVTMGTLGQATTSSNGIGTAVYINNSVVGDLYLVHLQGYSGTSVTGVTFGDLVNCERVALFGGSLATGAQTETGTAWAYTTDIRTTGTNASFTISFSGGSSGAEQVDLFMTPVAFGITPTTL